MKITLPVQYPAVDTHALEGCIAGPEPDGWVCPVATHAFVTPLKSSLLSIPPLRNASSGSNPEAMAAAQRDAAESGMGYKPRTGRENAQIGLKGFTQVRKAVHQLFFVFARFFGTAPVFPVT